MTSQGRIPPPNEKWAIPLQCGFHVMPLARSSKRPVGRWEAFRTRLPTSTEFTTWDQRDFNVAILTGAESGILVLDLDDEEALAEAERRGLPHTVWVKTPRGCHVYFAHPGHKVPNRAGIFRGADVRGDGGYVVAPGSFFEPTAEEAADGKKAGEYLWVIRPDQVALAPAPDWLLRAISSGTFPAVVTASNCELQIGESTALELERLRNAQKGERNNQLNLAAFKMAIDFCAGLISEVDAKSALRGAACQVDLPKDETEKTIASAWEAGIRKAPVEATEDGIARAFTLRHDADFIFDQHSQHWVAWTGSRWNAHADGQVLNLLRQLAREAGKASLRCARVVKGAEVLLRSEPTHQIDKPWDGDPMLIGVPSGIVDLKTGVCRAAVRGDMVTKVATITPVQGRPQLWERFLFEATGGDEELIGFLKRLCGYFLTGLTREQVLTFLYGGGGNGKSVFIETLLYCMGDYGVVANMDAFTASDAERHPTELARLDGHRLATASETRHGSRWDEAKLKQLTGGDAIAARFMRRDFFTYKPQFKLLFAGNHKPQLVAVDEAIRRRILVIPFLIRPLRPDPDLTRKLREEAGEILHWMIEGTLEWQRAGLNPSLAVRDETSAYFEAEDHLGRWIEECCVVGPVHKAMPMDLYGSWSTFAEQHELTTHSLVAFGGQLEARGYRRHKVNGVRYHIRIALK